jgi:hypothetical protein
MANVTKAVIEKAIRKKFNLSKSDFSLHKDLGSWYWGGDVVVDFEETCTFNISLNQITLQQWVDSFTFDYKYAPRNP